VVRSQRGPEGGYRLARPAGEISLGEVIRAVDGPLASVRGEAPEDLAYEGSADALRSVWVALRANLRAVLDEVSVGEVAAGKLPSHVEQLTRDPEAWTRR
jgi:Rrf2 family protein